VMIRPHVRSKKSAQHFLSGSARVTGLAASRGVAWHQLRRVTPTDLRRTAVNVSGHGLWWPGFRCPLVAGFGCPPRDKDSDPLILGLHAAVIDGNDDCTPTRRLALPTTPSKTAA